MNLKNNIFSRKLRECLTLAILIFGFIYLTGDSDKNSFRNSDILSTAQIVLESSNVEHNSFPESNPNDVSGNSVPLDDSNSWLIEIEIATVYGKSNRNIVQGKSQFANQAPIKKSKYTTDSKNTLSLVDSDLAHQFTLLGEKPSGTS